MIAKMITKQLFLMIKGGNMPGKRITSFIGLIIIVLFVSGCAVHPSPNEAVATHFASAATDAVTTEVISDTPSAEPTYPQPTSAESADTLLPGCHKIAFAQSDGTQYDIFTVCPDGSKLVNLTNDPADDVAPAWSPDGKKLAFASARSGHFQIYQMAEDGTEVVQLTSDDENLNPVWLPDGKRIAFRTDDGKGLFWWRVLNLETSELVTLSEPTYDFFFQTPAWSPDGQKIAYMSLVEQQARNDGSSQIHVKNVDGSNDIALTQDVWGNFNPKWSSDGTKIAFLSERGGTYNLFALYVMNQDGTNVEQVSEAGYPEDVVYSWSPDDQQIVIGNNNLFTGISIIDVESKTLHPLMEWTTPANVTWPAWQP
jgi:Tol biopolymer transport system component